MFVLTLFTLFRASAYLISVNGHAQKYIGPKSCSPKDRYAVTVVYVVHVVSRLYTSPTKKISLYELNFIFS